MERKKGYCPPYLTNNFLLKILFTHHIESYLIFMYVVQFDNFLKN
jgi:hypothetical protein